MISDQQSSSSNAPRQATSMETLLSRVAQLCALGRLPEATALRAFQRAYRAATKHYVAENAGESDIFRAAQVLSEWHQNPTFLDRDGLPAPLSLAQRQFVGLCSVAAEDADPEKLLDLLTHAGAVECRGDYLVATRRELILGETHPAAVARAVRVSSEFIATLTHNLSRSVSEPSRFERAVVTEKLTPRNIPPLLAYLSVHGQAFLEDLDSWMSSREEDSAGTEVGVGVYLYVRSVP